MDLLGLGIQEQAKASIAIPDWEDVDYILTEAVYKSYTVPGDVMFSTGDPLTPDETRNAPPVLLDYSGQDPLMESYVFRAKFDKPTSQVNLDILGNEAHFFSFAIYVHRKDGEVYTVKSGELVHVWHNGPEGHETQIKIPTADESRAILLRFGITELDHDERIAIFTFKANGIEKGKEVRTWNPLDDQALNGAYIIESLLLEEVDGDIDEITMTMLSKLPADSDQARGGDSFIAGVVLADLPCEEYEPELLCSYTQGFYGNKGGKMCGRMGTSELLKMLLDTDLIMGLPGTEKEPGNSLTIKAGHVDCVLDLLPGGGPSAALSGDASCENLGTIEVKNGRLKNSLLAQGITLTLNTRLSPDLPSFPVDGTEFVTMMAVDCFDPEAGGIPGTEKTYAFSPEIVNELADGATIADLLDLVNRALGGEDISPLNLSQVSDAANLVNEAFDECVVVKGDADSEPVDQASGEKGDGSGDPDEASGDTDEEDEKQGGTKGVTGVADYKEGILGIYPNPAIDYFNLRIPSSVDQVQHAAIFSLTGVKVMDIDQLIMSGVNQVIEINVSDLNKGVYFVRIKTATGFVNERFGVQ